MGYFVEDVTYFEERELEFLEYEQALYEHALNELENLEGEN